jgi:tRNA modification GTPase
MNDDQTIFAPASAVGKAGVTVFRVSGKDARLAITQLCVPHDLPEVRMATLREIQNPKNLDIVDRALILYFVAPHSFTGEDVVEFHTHGGRAVSQAVLDCLQLLPNFRLAEPGEFTRRAFENGKMDLTEAEAIADLVHADTEAQRKQALRQMSGALGTLYESWRSRLSKSLAYMEAAIDFSEEELPADMIEKQNSDLRVLCEEIKIYLNDHHRGERLREGFSIAILGAPNAGKSSLLNTLARRDAAIVSPRAGTTRDIIEVHLDIDGYPVILADTAGLHESTDSIENEGIRRARLRAEQSDLKILVIDASEPKLDPTLKNLLDAETIIVRNKIDLSDAKPISSELSSYSILSISALKGEGIEFLLQKLKKEIEARFIDHGTPPLTRTRHRKALEECTQHLDRGLNAFIADLRAEDVRLAMRSLGRITGRVDVEDLLDVIFRDFCIGK